MLKYKTAIAPFSNDSASIAYNNVHITTQLIQILIDEILYDVIMAILWGTGFIGNVKFYEIGTSLAETAFMENGIYGKRVDTP